MNIVCDNSRNTYCTLFNIAYLVKGLTLYRSMERSIDRFHLYILAMDAKTRDILITLNLRSATVLYYEDLMDEDLKEALQGRIGPSFFWTFTPIVIEYIIREKHEKWCTYIDADCYFLKDPGEVFDLIYDGQYSIGVIEHRYRRDEEYEKWIRLDGRFNVAFNTFRDDANSLQILKDWRKQCLDCCTNKPDGVSFGDQLYLNEWPDRYNGIYIVENEGIDVAPWNVNNYSVCKTSETAYSVERDGIKTELFMYHFHAISFVSKHIVSLNLWNPKARSETRDLFALYREYITEYRQQQGIIDRIEVDQKESVRSYEDNDCKLFKLRSLVNKFLERRDKGLVSLYRNIMWV